MKTCKNFKIESLGIQEQTVYDIETADNHNFYASSPTPNNGLYDHSKAKGVLLHNSNYLTLEKVIDKLGITFKDNEAFANWMKDFIDTVIQPMIDSALTEYNYVYGLNDIIKFKPEKIIKDMFVVAGKNYALAVVEDEKGNTWYDEPKVSITGIPVKKKTAQKIARTHLPGILDKIMTGSTAAEIADLLAPIKELYINGDDGFEEVFIAGKTNDITSYDLGYNYIKEEGFRFKKRTPWKVKGALAHNYILEDLGIKTVFPITNGMMCKTCYVRPNNKWGVNLITWEDTYPKEFKGLFEIDRHLMWSKGVENMINKWGGVVGWGDINLDVDLGLNDLMGF
jgi:hypothetical protein